MKADRDYLKRRSDEFFLLAEEMLDKGRYNISALASEQAVQLLLKHAIYLKAGDYPQTHELARLFAETAAIYDQPELLEFQRHNLLAIDSLEDAYLTSRYIGKEFTLEEAQALLDLSQGIADTLKLNVS